MPFRTPNFARDSAAASGLSTFLLILSIVVITGTALFIVALAIGLGVGFGVSDRSTYTAPVTLTPPVVNCASSSATCGCQANAPSYAPRIISGTTAVTNSWPWLVYLTMNNTRVCTGILISQRYVLTAGSCVAQYAGNLSVNLGVNAYQGTYGSTNVTNATVLPQIGNGDIALVQLGINITYSSTIRPCCLTFTQTVPTNGTTGVVAGWGETSSSTIGSVSALLQQAVVQVGNTTACGTQNFNDTLCASFGSVSTCPIDSGGPLMINYNNLWTCVGIITGRVGSCTTAIPFTRIASYANIIQNATAGTVFI